jgi:hypothetical protein
MPILRILSSGVFDTSDLHTETGAICGQTPRARIVLAARFRAGLSAVRCAHKRCFASAKRRRAGMAAILAPIVIV